MVIINPENGGVVKGDLGYGEIKMFDEHSLPGPGWALIAIVYSDDVETHSGDVVVWKEPYQDTYGSHMGGHFETTTVHNMKFKRRQPKFVMGRLKDKAWEELTKERDLAKIDENARRLALEKTRKEKEEVEKNLKTAVEQREAAYNKRDEQKLKRLEAEDKFNRLEKDLAKIRGEIGDKRWRELVGEEK